MAPDDTGTTPQAPQRKRRGLAWVIWPLLGGALAAAAGYGVAQYVPNGWPMASVVTLQTQVAVLSDQVQTLQADLQKADARLASLETAPAPQSDAGQIAALELRLAALESKPMPAGTDSAALDQLRAEVAAIKTNGAAVMSAQVQADLDAKVQATEAKLTAIEQSAQAQAAATLTRAALGQIAAALDSGAPYPSAIAALAGADIAVVLTDNASAGLPSLQALQASFPDSARTALEAALRANMGESWSERVGNFLRTQVGVRSLTPRDGPDPDAILSRAEAALTAGDVAQALAEIATLPTPAQDALSAWRVRAQLRLDAQAALAALLAKAG
ncbi:MAG: hypothetical protein RLZZ607_2511 [Pseudomonadota bacterium]